MPACTDANFSFSIDILFLLLILSVFVLPFSLLDESVDYSPPAKKRRQSADVTTASTRPGLTTATELTPAGTDDGDRADPARTDDCDGADPAGTEGCDGADLARTDGYTKTGDDDTTQVADPGRPASPLDEESSPLTFTNLRQLDPNDCSFNSLNLSTSDCSLSLLQDFEIDMTGSGLQMLYRADELVTGNADTLADMASGSSTSATVVGPAGTGGSHDRSDDPEKENRHRTVPSTYTEKHPLLPPPVACSEGRCRKQCANKIPAAVRQDLNRGVGMNWDSRVFWYQKHVQEKSVQGEHAAVTVNVRNPSCGICLLMESWCLSARVFPGNCWVEAEQRRAHPHGSGRQICSARR